MKVNVNEDCIGCGLCESMCPQVFQIGADNVSEAISTDEVFRDQAEEAAMACPVNAIEVE